MYKYRTGNPCHMQQVYYKYQKWGLPQNKVFSVMKNVKSSKLIFVSHQNTIMKLNFAQHGGGGGWKRERERFILEYEIAWLKSVRLQ